MAAPSWAPTLDRVAAGLRARTRGTASESSADAAERGTFDENTRPTGAQALLLIEQACDDVLAALDGRTPCSEATEAACRSAAVYRAQQLIEISYHPESEGRGSALESLEQLAADAIDRAARLVEKRCPLPPETPGGNGLPLAPAGRGRNPCYPVLGFGTRW